MKVLMVNGSPKSKGNTAAALAEIGAALEGHGIEWEVFQLGAAPVRDCIGCGKCAELDCACVFDDDMVNELIKAAQQADGFIFGTPVYYAHPTGRILSALDRAFYAGGAAFEHNRVRRSPWLAAEASRHRSTCSTNISLSNRCPLWRRPIGMACTDACRAKLRSMRKACARCAISATTWPWMLKCIELGPRKWHRAAHCRSGRHDELHSLGACGRFCGYTREAVLGASRAR